MFDSLLIANRGEIACRIIRSARRLGLRTIAVYSDADRGARHVGLADAALRIGPAPANDSYLSTAALLEAARQSGAAAIHPGYGFLSENAVFARSCSEAGLVFVGPPAEVIAAMGSKSAAKEAMRRVGVPVLPGYHGADQSLEALAERGLVLGFPLIVKPSGGGGGKGMQIVNEPGALQPALAAARRLAERSFGDPSLLLERYLPAPRHVEVQILADAHGRVLHLFDRDCSVQRRHQKLIEEAPAPDIPDSVRARLHEAALTVARSIGYVSAGTVEFLYAGDEFFFMEMNTRVQVEHPVTELITGLDLVEWQLRIAAGERLPFAQEMLRACGCAIEARVCAEDPAEDFAPSAGRATRLEWPAPAEGLRVDAGFGANDEVPAEYDSLLGKVIAFATARPLAVAQLATALDQIRVSGIRVNANWLARALRTEALRKGAVTTRFVIEHEALLADPARDPGELARAVAIAALLVCAPGAEPADAPQSPWRRTDSFRLGLPSTRVVRLRLRDELITVELNATAAPRAYLASVAGRRFALTNLSVAGDVRVEVDGGQQVLDWRQEGRLVQLWIDGVDWRFELPAPAAEIAGGNPLAGGLVARLPGTVARLLVEAGASVVAGQPLLIVEAMKMEHTIRAPYAGRIERLCFAAGERVIEGAALIEMTRSD